MEEAIATLLKVAPDSRMRKVVYEVLLTGWLMLEIMKITFIKSRL